MFYPFFGHFPGIEFAYSLLNLGSSMTAYSSRVTIFSLSEGEMLVKRMFSPSLQFPVQSCQANGQNTHHDCFVERTKLEIGGRLDPVLGDSLQARIQSCSCAFVFHVPVSPLMRGIVGSGCLSRVFSVGSRVDSFRNIPS